MLQCSNYSCLIFIQTMQCHEDSQQTYRVVHKEIYIYKTNQLEKLRAAKAVYLRLHLVTFGYLWLHLVTFGYLWLPLVTFP